MRDEGGGVVVNLIIYMEGGKKFMGFLLCFENLFECMDLLLFCGY